MRSDQSEDLMDRVRRTCDLRVPLIGRSSRNMEVVFAVHESAISGSAYENAPSFHLHGC